MNGQDKPLPGSATLARPRDWRAHWCAETVRLHEQQVQRLDDSDLLAALRGQPGSDLDKLLQRAWQLAAAQQLQPPGLPWRGSGRWLSALIAIALLLIGLSGALAVLGDGSRPVNLLWTWLALLGLPSASLLLWLLLLPWQGRGEHRQSPALRLAVLPWWRFGAERAGLWLQALLALSQRSPAGWWLISLFSHLAWSVLLAGAALGLLLALSLRSYQFLWATTLLPAEFFAGLVAWLGSAPQWLGFTLPSVDAVMASGNQPLADDLVRRQWSSWLIGNLLVWGLLPRLLAAALAGWRCRHALRALQIDVDLPYYQQLLSRLQPESRPIGVIDAWNEPLPELRISCDPTLPAERRWLLGLELGDPARLPMPPPGVESLGLIDTREQRNIVLSRLQHSAAQRLLVLVDGGQSPDRGSLGLIAALSRHCAALAVSWPRDCEHDPRLGLWRDALLDMGLAAARIGTLEAQLAWLQDGR